MTEEAWKRLNQARGSLSVSEFLVQIIPLRPSGFLRVINRTVDELKGLFLQAPHSLGSEELVATAARLTTAIWGQVVTGDTEELSQILHDTSVQIKNLGKEEIQNAR